MPETSAVTNRSYRSYGKRAFDITLAVTGLVALSPILLLTACLVRLVLGPPILFRQQRPGFKGSVFTLYKFRTMSDDRDSQGRPEGDAQRLTGLGRLMRQASLDELPELWNVLRGDMSLVGPRPLLVQYLERYTVEQMRRHDVRPGITGWAQVNGRNNLSWEEKFRLDVWYVDNLSWRLDAKILALTVRRVLSRQGISAPGQATMGEFLGAAQSSDTSVTATRSKR